MNDIPNWTRLTPSFVHASKSLAVFLGYAKELSLCSDMEADAQAAAIGEKRERYLAASREWLSEDRQALVAAGLVLTDLALQRWRLRVSGDGVEVQLQGAIDKNLMAEKERIRRQELIKRDEQLAQPSVRGFIRSMEKMRRTAKGEGVSIYSLMRDGRELAASLRAVRALPKSAALAKLEQVIDPYLQFVSEDKRCEHTGFLLQDIWRYFRHTWSNQYTSVPGRGMIFLVRDRAAAFHPVIGIGALASPIVQIRERDNWIGWQPTELLEEVRAKPTDKLAQWLNALVEGSLNELYRDDLIEDGLLSLELFQRPTDAVILRLREEELQQKEKHQRFVDTRVLKSQKRDAISDERGTWVKKARSHLFRSKRAGSLADLLEARKVLGAYFSGLPTADGLAALVKDTSTHSTLLRIFRKAKADRVGTAMADISVCGAIQPYNAILGGKLVSMLSVSPEVAEAYRNRYSAAESEIASSMAGRPIVRPAHLVLFGTTSLYGIGSSQYNRIKIPCWLIGGRPKEWIQFEQLGKSKAFGTSHYGNATVEALVDLVRQSTNGQRVNSIFGEGVSPKFRKVRDGFDKLGLPSEILLQHGRHRIVYGITLVQNLKNYLLGIEKKPEYLVPMEDSKATTKKIVDWWKERWLLNRIFSEEVLQGVARHTKVRPMRHGARVVLPRIERVQASLFDDIY